MFVRVPLIASALAWVVSPEARAEGYSADIELVRPTFAYLGVPGVDSPAMRHRGAWRLGTLIQVEQDPLVLREFGAEKGVIVKNRENAHLGFVYDFSETASARVVLPMTNQAGTDVPELGADGFGLGDASFGARIRAVKAGPFLGGLRADLTFPTGKGQAWIGEESFRTAFGALAMLDTRRVDVLTDVGLLTRSQVLTQEDFTLGTEMNAAGALRYAIRPDSIAAYVAAVYRGGTDALFTGAAENPAEAMVGVQGKPLPQVELDVGLGRGLTSGYGTTAQRVLVGATFYWPLRQKPPPQIVEIPVEKPPVSEVTVEEILQKEQEWKEGELARVVGEQIEIRDPVQFEFAKETILPISIPTLRQVGSLLNSNDRIGHVVIEGHASEEGSFIYNYDLSIRRARAVWEQLILANVHPARLSYRGMGEVIHVSKGTDETELARDRRVQFHIVYQLGALDLAPKTEPIIHLPWSGVEATISPPPPGQVARTDLPDTGPAPGAIAPLAPSPELLEPPKTDSTTAPEDDDEVTVPQVEDLDDEDDGKEDPP